MEEPRPHRVQCPRGLDNGRRRATIRPISGDYFGPARAGMLTGFMTSIPPPPSPEKGNPKQCKHPKVQIVSREEDAEFVECLECGEIFDSSEFRDMSIEETKLREDS